MCERVAALLGKARGLLLPSGTMCNLIAVLVHCRPGDEILAADVSHLMSSESGGAGLSGALIRVLSSQRGVFTAEQVAAAVRPLQINAPRSRLLHVEQTVMRGGAARSGRLRRWKKSRKPPKRPVCCCTWMVRGC